MWTRVAEGPTRWGMAMWIGIPFMSRANFWKTTLDCNTAEYIDHLDEKCAQWFTKIWSLQKFASFNPSVSNHFNQERPLYSRHNFKLNRAAALAEWHFLCFAQVHGRAVKLRLIRICLTPLYNLFRIWMVSAVGVAYLRSMDMADKFCIYTLDVSTCGHGNAVQLGLLRGAKNFW